MSHSKTPRIGIIGCGAVTEWRHLPALAALHIAPALLVDTNVARARDFAKTFGARHVSDRYEPWAEEMDAAIVALPHHLHAPVSGDLLRRGIHVLVEKPMAVTSAEADAMVREAAGAGATLSVGLMRRFLNVNRWVKAVMDAGVLGTVESFRFEEGSVYGWPVASGFFFQKATSGGGVLADTGAHTLDLLLWWLGGVEVLEYADDSYGGVEADCRIRLRLPGGAGGTVELSRTRKLGQKAMLQGSRGWIEVSLDERRLNSVTASNRSLLAATGGGLRGDRLPAQVFQDLFVAQIEDWIEAIRGEKPPAVPGSEGARSVALIETCYGRRQLLSHPWVRVPASPSTERAQP